MKNWDLPLFMTEIAVLLVISWTTLPINADDVCKDSHHQDGPRIEPCKSDIVLQMGQNYTLTCKSKHSIVEFRQQEIPEEVISLNLIQKNEIIDEGEYKYKTVLDLYNVDQNTIGYYACFDATVQKNISSILNNLTEEPNNTAHIAYTYIYVNGTGSLFAPMREIVTPRDRLKLVIECRPTTPDIEVSLQPARSQSNKPADSITYSPKIGFLLRTCSRSAHICQGYLGSGNITEKKRIRNVSPPPEPKISGDLHEFLDGETFSINCTVPYQSSDLVNLFWQYPKNINESSIIIDTNERKSADGMLYKNITVVNASRDHNGKYICVSSNNCGTKQKEFGKIYLAEPKLVLKTFKKNPMNSYVDKNIKINIQIDAYPPATFYFLRDGVRLPSNSSKYNVTRNKYTGDAILLISNLTVTDTANYTLVASNTHLTANVTSDLRVQGPPIVVFGRGDKRYMKNTKVSLMCEVIGLPPPDITWVFSDDQEEQTLSSTSLNVQSVNKVTAYLDITVQTSGNITCKAKNGHIVDVTRRLLVYEIEDGFGIENKNTWFSQNQDVTLTCIASIHDFSSVTWIGPDEEVFNETVEYTERPLSHVVRLKMPRISLNESGKYTCRGERFDGSEKYEPIYISVAAVRAPIIKEPIMDKTEEVYPFQNIHLTCQAEGVPPPTVEWYKDAELMMNDSNANIYTNYINRTTVNSTIVISKMGDDYKGKYECLVNNSDGVITKRTYTLSYKEASYTTYLSAIIVIIFILIVIVIYLTIRIRKEKQFRRELAAAGLLYFKEGVPKSLNPDLGIDEQAELLPYDGKFEFPADKLVLGKQLGAGAFGVVYKAEARGIINAEETTEVAVKMVKNNADNMFIKALISELKIMVHLGKHVNIVNLLGAVTKNIERRELSVIVEYCKFGNIHNYMQRHREVFIDQLTGDREKNLGKVNRGFSCSSGSTGAHSDYFGASNTQQTDHTFVNTGNTNRSTRKVSDGYVQPAWRSNYESDYNMYDGRNPRPLTSRDLLAWAFQIARGMEYLASRKVLHSDLAARNVLLADDNIVKICDFGLARSIYKNDEYQKKENTLLPVKWLAIECMTDRIFSTQSDVWSFGVVLWELFSLAKTPYPNFSTSDLLRWLTEGKRLPQPAYADDRLYEVMLKCWEQKPTARPTFTRLQEIIGGFLEDNVRNHFVDLNSTYLNMNAKPSGHEDYLTLVNAPDYNNLVTPSPHHYVNETRSFFPTTPKLDDDGYLKMNPGTRQVIFSPRLENNKFDFDARKFSPKESDTSSCGSELTPMLTLNNLPARSGSESDHEGSTSPNIAITCPTIDEETDEVFEIKQNNVKNEICNSAVTNPTYITVVDIENKPKDINRAYVNISNGLVK